jgi:hypothetical protein
MAVLLSETFIVSSESSLWLIFWALPRNGDQNDVIWTGLFDGDD